MRHKLLGLGVVAVSLGMSAQVYARNYYVDSVSGNNSKDGKTQANAWKSLWKVNNKALKPGDKIYLKRGSVFYNRLLVVNEDGTSSNPINVNCYGSGNLPVINSAGYKAGIFIDGSDYIKVSNVKVTSDAKAPIDGHSRLERYGAYIRNSKGCSLTAVTIDRIFSTDQENRDVWQAGKTLSSNKGRGVYTKNANSTKITNCTISRTGFHGIHLSDSNYCTVSGSTLKDIGGAGMVPWGCNNLVVRNNKVWPGSFVDSRMHGRGSGIWPIECEYVLIEKNEFRGARGRADSCGAHIDHDNKHVVIQYNLSENNEGGFVEILGGNENCTYRYNISINDGSRSDADYGTGTLGYSIVVNGHGGHNTKNCYIYNNTVYVKSGQPARFAVQDTTKGLLVANNIFYFVGAASTGSWANHEASRIVWKNNLYQSANDFPSALKFDNQSAKVGNPAFTNAGSTWKAGYTPTKGWLIKDGGIAITKLANDTVGIKSWSGVEGLTVTKDIFGNAIQGKPDYGAVELGTK